MNIRSDCCVISFADDRGAQVTARTARSALRGRFSWRTKFVGTGCRRCADGSLSLSTRSAAALNGRFLRGRSCAAIIEMRYAPLQLPAEAVRCWKRYIPGLLASLLPLTREPAA
jgi:hypothetical protein